MGLALTLTAALFLAALAIARPRVLPYLFLGLIVFFDELGSGFTSFNGSFVFNQNFVNLFNLKFIEIVTAAAWAPLILLGGRRGGRPPVMRSEKRMGIALLVLICILLTVEYVVHRTVLVSDWRLLIAGAMLIHILVIQLDTEERIVRFIRLFLVLLAARALIGLAMFAAGYGVMSPRGMVPFFWDSRQVDAFAFGAILLAAYLANYRSLSGFHRILPRPIAAVMFAILALTILLSFRRTVWMVTFLGVGTVFLLSRHVKLLHYVFLGALMLVGVLVFALLPGKGGDSRIETYISSMNLFDEREATNIENKVHFDNVTQYTRMIAEHPDILAFGLHGPSGSQSARLISHYSDEFQLGLAHNGILRTIHFFGVGGLLIYFWFYLRVISRFPAARRAQETSILKHTAVAALVFLFAEFAAALTFVPPFYTSVKGLYYTFLAVFLVNAALHYARVTPAGHPLRQPLGVPG